MTMTRRSFLARSSLALAGGLLVGDAALEAFERLTHRKVWALGGLSPQDAFARLRGITEKEIADALKELYADMREATTPLVTPLPVRVLDAPRSLFSPTIKPVYWDAVRRT